MNFDIEQLAYSIDMFYYENNRMPIIWAGATAFHKLRELDAGYDAMCTESHVFYKACQVRLDKTLRNDEIVLE